MRRGTTFSRNPSNRIDEENEAYETSSSEDELIPAPQPASGIRSKASSNLFEGELAPKDGTSPTLGSDGEDADDDDRLADEYDLVTNNLGPSGDREDAIRTRIAQSQDQMKHLLDLFTEEQFKRYETFRRVGFPRPAIKKLMMRVLEQQGLGVGAAAGSVVNQNSVIVVAGIAKVYVGELVEEARRVVEEEAERTPGAIPGPIQPSHLLEAQRRLKASGLSSTSSIYKRHKNRLL